MDLYEIIDQVVALLQKHGRVTYRALKLQFHLDDEHLEALKDEIIEARELARDKDGKVLVWTGEEGNGESGQQRPHPSTQHLTPSPLSVILLPTSPSASGPSKPRWKRAAPLTASARPSPRSLLTSKAPPP